MIEIEGADTQMSDKELKLFLSELMGEEEFEKHEKEKKLKSVEIPTVESSAGNKTVVQKIVKNAPRPKKEPKPKVKIPEEKDKRVLLRLGTKLDDVALLEDRDLNLDERGKSELKENLLNRLAHAPKKIQNRITYFVEYIADLSAVLPEVLNMGIHVLVKDGYISASNKMADCGNFYKKLIDRPYAPASASAMGANTVKAMQVLKLVVPDDNGRLVINRQSRHLRTIVSKLGLQLQ